MWRSMLDPVSRTAIVGLSALCVAGMLALAPVGARGFGASPVPGRAAALAPPLANVVAIPNRRDPFAEPQASAAPAAPPIAAPLLRASPHDEGDALEPLPGNVPDAVIPQVPGSAPDVQRGTSRVTALVTGPHPYALIETAGGHIIAGIGDRVDGSVITAIDLDGVRLQNGARLTVAHGEGL